MDVAVTDKPEVLTAPTQHKWNSTAVKDDNEIAYLRRLRNQAHVLLVCDCKPSILASVAHLVAIGKGIVQQRRKLQKILRVLYRNSWKFDNPAQAVVMSAEPRGSGLRAVNPVGYQHSP